MFIEESKVDALKLVTIVIPAYNSEKCINHCIDSCLKQTYSAIEIIVVNDGSNDNTDKILQNYGNQIRYFVKENGGQASARNVGIKNGVGKYIAFLDADDYLKNTFIEECVGFLQLHENLVAVHTMLQIDTKGKAFIQPKELCGISEPFIPGNFIKFWATYGNIQTGAMLINYDVVRKVGYQNEGLRISQDWEYWLLISLEGEWGYIPKALYVNNSEENSKGGWISHYKTRRKLCPTVEMWQERLIGKFSDRDIPYFNKIRGQVALGYAQNHILAGRYDVAFDIVNKYGSSMGVGRLQSLFRWGAMSNFMWNMICYIVLAKEHYKNFIMR